MDITELPYDKAVLRDKMGKNRTQSLFLEYYHHNIHLLPIFTLKEEDFFHEPSGVQCLSLKRLYLEECDPTEYMFATKYFYSFYQWEKLARHKQLAVHVNRWREELGLLIKARSIQKNIELAGRGSYNASKWLSDRGWEEKDRGRPSKAEKDRKLKEDTALLKEIQKDAKRLKAVG